MIPDTMNVHALHDQSSSSPGSSAVQRQRGSIQSRGHTGESGSDTDSDSDLETEHYNPGDGVCPSMSQFIKCYEVSYEAWKSAASLPREGSQSIEFYVDQLLRLVRDVPPFLQNPPENVNINGGIMRSTLQLETTEDPTCDQSQKHIDYLQCVGFPAPVTYQTQKPGTQLPIPSPLSSGGHLSTCFTDIVLAWSYIVSCRWVEILCRAGKRCSMLHEEGDQTTNGFWNMVLGNRWAARLEMRKGYCYSPWMLRDQSVRPEQLNHLTLVSPGSSRAFDILWDFCRREELQGEFLLGFGSVLMLTSRNIPPPKLPPPTGCARPVVQSPFKDTHFHKIFDSIDRFMFLSSTQDALDSLLCSAFFDPCVPCNLIGAASLGARNALVHNDANDNKVLDAITHSKPYLSVLWAAAMCTDQAPSLWNLATTYSLPPLCLVAAFLTNTVQSFLQVTYQTETKTDLIVSRAEEFQTSYYCRPDISVPWSPAPPFGRTVVGNLSLEVRAHLGHKHKPLSWMICWTTKSGERIPASVRHQIKSGQICPLCHHDADSTGASHDVLDRRAADDRSWNATSRLFNWHRDSDDGIWLDDGTGNVEAIRQLQTHPWIVDPFQDDFNEALPGKKEYGSLRRESVLEWNEDVQRHRESQHLLKSCGHPSVHE